MGGGHRSRCSYRGRMGSRYHTKVAVLLPVQPLYGPYARMGHTHRMPHMQPYMRADCAHVRLFGNTRQPALFPNSRKPYPLRTYGNSRSRIIFPYIRKPCHLRMYGDTSGPSLFPYIRREHLLGVHGDPLTCMRAGYSLVHHRDGVIRIADETLACAVGGEFLASQLI